MTEYQRLTAAYDRAVKAVVDAEMQITEVEVKLETAQAASKVTSLDLRDVDGAAERRATELQKVLVLRDMLDKAKEAHSAAQEAVREASDAVAAAEYARAELDIQERLEELIPAVLAAHDIIKDMALCYHKMLDRQPVASVQSPLDQMLTDVMEIAKRGENYTGSTSHRDVNTFDKIKAFYPAFGSEYGLKIHKHLSALGRWHQQPRGSEAYQAGLKQYVDQKKKRAKKSSHLPAAVSQQNGNEKAASSNAQCSRTVLRC